MSYDIYFTIAVSEDRHATIEERNITSNLAPMFRLVLGDRGIHRLNGMTAQDARKIIIGALVECQEKEENLRELEPINGWGNYSSFVDFMQWLYACCFRCTKCTISIYS